MSHKSLRSKLIEIVLAYAGTALGWIAGALVVSIFYQTLSTGGSKDGIFDWIPLGLVGGSLLGPWAALRAFRRRGGLVVGATTAVLTAGVLLAASRWQMLGVLLWAIPAASIAVRELVSAESSTGDRPADRLA